MLFKCNRLLFHGEWYLNVQRNFVRAFKPTVQVKTGTALLGHTSLFKGTPCLFWIQCYCETFHFVYLGCEKKLLELRRAVYDHGSFAVAVE